MISFTDNDLILITGASSGIGRSASLLLNKLGARVIGISRSYNNLLEVQKDCSIPDNFYTFVRDLSDDLDGIPNFVQSIAEKHGKLSGFIHSAGCLRTEPLQILNIENAQNDFNLLYFSAMMITKALVNKNYRAKNLSVAYVSSLAAKLGNSGSSNYAAAKGALCSLAVSLAKELGRYKIRVNSILPGWVDTEMFNSYTQMTGNKHFSEQIKSRTAFNEMAKPEYIADLLVFLISDKSYWITGQNIVIDGGEGLF